MLPEVTFELYDAEKNLLTEAKTDSDGIILFSHLKKGTYYLKEKTPLEEYRKDENEYAITLDKDLLYEITLFNEKKKGKAQIMKIDKKTKEILSGATLEIYHKKTNKKIKKLVTEKKPVTISLEEGSYYLKEIIAPQGYGCSKETFEFEIKNNQTTILEIENELILENPDTKDSIMIWVQLFLTSFLVLIMSIFVVKKRT